MILRILASNRSCFTALWAIIKLLLALLLDMATAVGRDTLKAVFYKLPPPSERKFTPNGYKLNPRGETSSTGQCPAPAVPMRHWIGL